MHDSMVAFGAGALAASAFFIGSLLLGEPPEQPAPSPTPVPEIQLTVIDELNPYNNTPATPLWPLFEAICLVESNNSPTAVGDDGRAVGIAQIWPILVDDVNRIAGTSYTYEDRWSVAKSGEMFRIYSEHYASHHNDHSPEGIARRWNGGPDGHTQTATEPYWARVRQVLEQIQQ